MIIGQRCLHIPGGHCGVDADRELAGFTPPSAFQPPKRGLRILKDSPSVIEKLQTCNGGTCTPVGAFEQNRTNPIFEIA